MFVDFMEGFLNLLRQHAFNNGDGGRREKGWWRWWLWRFPRANLPVANFQKFALFHCLAKNLDAGATTERLQFIGVSRTAVTVGRSHGVAGAMEAPVVAPFFCLLMIGLSYLDAMKSPFLSGGCDRSMFKDDLDGASIIDASEYEAPHACYPRI